MTGFPEHKLTPELKKQADIIFGMAKDYGLTFFPIKFALVDPKELNAVAAYDGFPARMPHWTYGMEFENIHKRYQYGQSKIYELVINTNPVIAYLLNTNSLVEQKLVMIHVCAHADFFYNNAWFKTTNRDMLDQMANNSSRVHRIAQRQGGSRVEEFIDTCMSLENLVDPYLAHIKRQGPKADEEQPLNVLIPKLKANEYMDRYVNTKDFIELQKKKLDDERKKQKKFPSDPERDILGFLVEHAPMERWQRDILGMIREESNYFSAQRMTKVMNEGWATYIHSKFMTTKLATDSEIIDYCDSQSRAIAAHGGVNPYRLGLHLYKDIEDRWNKGRFGPEYERCESFEKKLTWDTKLGKGTEKIFQVRATHNDLTFLDDFMTPEFAVEEDLFAYERNEFNHTDITREFNKVKDQFLRAFTNGGQPVIQVMDANHGNKGELKLEHVFEGQELDPKKGKDTLHHLFKVWSRPVHIETTEIGEKGNSRVLWSYDGKEHTKAVLA